MVEDVWFVFDCVIDAVFVLDVWVNARTIVLDDEERVPFKKTSRSVPTAEHRGAAVADAPKGAPGGF